MLDGINNLGAGSRITGPAPKANEPVGPAFKVDAAHAPENGFPATPPPEVLASLDKAARVIEELASRQVNLRFSVDDRTQKVHVEVRNGKGDLVRQIPATTGLDVLAGDVPAVVPVPPRR